jgi:hypothetical protein
MKSKKRCGLQTLILLTSVCVFHAGCSIYALTGDSLSGYAVEHMGPYVTGTEDLQMACELGQSFGNLIMSYERVTDRPDKAALFSLIAAGMCSEMGAYEAELEYARHMHANRHVDAQDARIKEQRARMLTSRRFYRAYQRLVAAYGEPGSACPELEENEELLYLLGLSVGVQALLHDRASGGHVGVDMGLPMKVARATQCLHDDKMWSVPSAVRAGVFASLPGTAPKGVDPWKMLEANAKQGDESGVRMARAILIQALIFAGRTDEGKVAIHAHAEARSAHPAPDNGRLLDAYAHQIVRHFSDLLWLENTGHRTPIGQLGSFWDDPEEEDSDFLDDLES